MIPTDSSIHAAVQSMEALIRLQHAYIDALNADPMLDNLEQHHQEHQNAFRRFKDDMDVFLYSTRNLSDNETQENLLRACQEHVSVLVAQNRTLEAKLNYRREQIADTIKQIVRGKRGLKSYGSPQSFSGRARVMKIRE